MPWNVLFQTKVLDFSNTPIYPFTNVMEASSGEMKGDEFPKWNSLMAQAVCLFVRASRNAVMYKMSIHSHTPCKALKVK